MSLRLLFLAAVAAMLQFALLTQPASAEAAGKPCNLAQSRAVARTFALSIPALAQSNRVVHPITDPHPVFKQAVRDYPSVFLEATGAMACSRALGDALLHAGAATFNPNAYRDVLGRFGGNSRFPELRQQVADSLNSGSLNLIMLGDELIWLSRVMPAAARGDWGPYQATQTLFRSVVRQQTQIANVYGQSDPNIIDWVLQMMGQTLGIQDCAEQQIVFLAFAAFGNLD